MSDLDPIPQTSTNSKFSYAYIGRNGERLEAILEVHSCDELENTYISHIGFIELANNLEINLEELHFKYSPISEVCKNRTDTYERCYNLGAVFSIFSELKPGMIRREKEWCCYSTLPLCSQAFRDQTYWTRIKENGSVYFAGSADCLLETSHYCFTSRQRLISRGDILVTGNKEYTLHNNPSITNHWLWHFKRREKSIKRLLRLDKQMSMIYQDKGKSPEYY
jgi:hypothetical protein